MCIALPMRVQALTQKGVLCRRAGRSLFADASLAGESLAPGDYVLVFRNDILRRLEAEEARRIENALRCLDAIMSGDAPDVESAFADILEHTGELPDHLQSRSSRPSPHRKKHGGSEPA